MSDLTGRRFGRLVVVARGAKYNDRYYWQVQCDCGRVKMVASGALTRRNKGTTSCGCWKAAQARQRNFDKAAKVDGHTYAELAQLLGVHRRTMYRRLLKGIPLDAPPSAQHIDAAHHSAVARRQKRALHAVSTEAFAANGYTWPGGV